MYFGYLILDAIFLNMYWIQILGNPSFICIQHLFICLVVFDQCTDLKCKKKKKEFNFVLPTCILLNNLERLHSSVMYVSAPGALV